MGQHDQIAGDGSCGRRAGWVTRRGSDASSRTGRRDGLSHKIWWLIGQFVSFEGLFVMFLYSNEIKVLMPATPVDTTLLFGAATMGLGAYLISREGLYVRGLMITGAAALFICYAIVSFYVDAVAVRWSDSPRLSGRLQCLVRDLRRPDHRPQPRAHLALLVPHARSLAVRRRLRHGHLRQVRQFPHARHVGSARLLAHLPELGLCRRRRRRRGDGGHPVQSSAEPEAGRGRGHAPDLHVIPAGRRRPRAVAGLGAWPAW